MANSATAQTVLPIRMQHATSDKHFVTPVAVVIDTTATDLTVYTPASDAYAAIVGLHINDSTAANLTIKSGSTALLTLEMAANQAINHAIGQGIFLSTAEGEALKFNSSGALSNVLVYIAEYSDLGI